MLKRPKKGKLTFIQFYCGITVSQDIMPCIEEWTFRQKILCAQHWMRMSTSSERTTLRTASTSLGNYQTASPLETVSSWIRQDSMDPCMISLNTRRSFPVFYNLSRKYHMIFLSVNLSVYPRKLRSDILSRITLSICGSDRL